TDTYSNQSPSPSQTQHQCQEKKECKDKKKENPTLDAFDLLQTFYSINIPPTTPATTTPKRPIISTVQPLAALLLGIPVGANSPSLPKPP
ncbi:hypothetical protein OFC13_28150, partial [Escherichia coli]|nr:hypothetical protein [Escherichia coli]